MESLKTIGAHIADIRITVRQTSDDSNYSDEYIYKLISDARALLLHQEIYKHRKLSEWNFQTFCVKLEPATYHDCSCITDIGCKIMKSTIKIPKPLLSRFKNYFKVYNITQDFEIYKTTPMQLKRDKYSNTRNGIRGYDISNERLILFNSNGMNHVLIRGVFEDPVLVSMTSACPSADICTDILKVEFPIDVRFNSILKEMVVKQLIGSMQLPDDKTNNAESSVTKI
ncbi:MAG: hypothetical protein KatS3mg002_1393 [Candidatus Woesearchaeota archaeon]|nr:MAG: hypothetical protein KatS3mg002_1393 [Candidatus Woesearchaeota archaeon]